MGSLRDFVRGHVPGSTVVYERLLHVRKRRSARRVIQEISSRSASIMLDIGSGGRRGSGGWITIDTVNGCDLYWDLREGIPFEDNTVSAIYSSHLFEHLDYADGQVLLSECFRVLKPGGTFSIAVPNARIYIEGYLGVREVPSNYFGWTPAFNNTTAIDAVNYVAYMAGEHKYLFDEENLVHRLQSVGFVDAQPRSFDPLIDLPEREYESIYALGTKPVGLG